LPLPLPEPSRTTGPAAISPRAVPVKSQHHDSKDSEELAKYKTALGRLQSQSKVAIDKMMEIIGQQQKDYLKLVSVLREMKLEIIEEQKNLTNSVSKIENCILI